MYQRTPRRNKSAQEFIWPAPVMGLLKSGAVIGGSPSGAEVLTNFIPTAEGARLRGGSVKWATIDDAVREFLLYRSGTVENMFAASDTQIHNVSAPADPDAVAVPTLRGFSSGDWSSNLFSTDAGQFLIAVNGNDYLHRFDGSSWNPTSGVAVNTLSYDALSADFLTGITVTGGTSGASATILSIQPATATTGALKLGAITGGPFVDNEALTASTGAAVANGASAAGSALAITGLATTELNFVWSHKRRLWFIENDSLSAWYLPIDSIAGTLEEFPINAVFRLGGRLLFGGTWSVDAGSGLDDLQIFVSTEGEVAVYSGVDPATDFALVGTYRIGKPLNKRGWFNTGADFLILTKDSVVPISEALQKDRVALQGAAISAPIETLWASAVARSDADFNYSVSMWPSRTVALIGIPDAVALVVNTRTGGWADISGWDVQASCVYDDELYFGTEAAAVFKADTGGSDDGEAYTGYYVPKFQEMQTLDDKIALHCRLLYRSKAQAEPRLTCFQNYELGEYPTSGEISNSGSSVWGVMVWGEFVWGASTDTTVSSVWQAVSGQGFSLAPVMVITSSQIETPVFEILGLGLRFEVGRSI